MAYKNKPETGEKALALHTRYIVNNEKPPAGFPQHGPRNLTRDEMDEIAWSFRASPRVGCVSSGRKRENELIAIPRGLLEYFCNEAVYFAYIHELWQNGKLGEEGSGVPSTDDS